MIVEAALQEDVDIIGLSILSGAHMELSRRLFDLLNEMEMADVPVFLGGIIPNDDIPQLLELGISEVFGPGTNSEQIVTRIKEVVLSERSN